MPNFGQSSEQNYEVTKVLNNNVVLAEGIGSREEIVVIGKGLGFSNSIGDILSTDDPKIDKTFVAVNKENKEKYQRLVANVDKEVIGVTEEIIAMASEELGEELDEHIHIALADHIQFSLKRLKEGMEILNPFLAETQTLYSTEYNLAKKSVALIEKRLGIEMPVAEVGFITLHLHAAKNNLKVSKTVKYTSLIKSMIEAVEEELAIKLSRESLNHARLVTHLRFALKRIEDETPNQNPILATIKNNFNDAYQLAEELARMIEDRLELEVPIDEVGYIALHLQRLKKNINQ
ncbi:MULTISPECIES: glucose PTS transporter transcription antiterminator GlcT [unclassified Candidatus Frackibacter]|uniref:glucose PTS transporter transcription antiterminator GlcT n=1 Tax=unclassified Candidatus Frackibacter TaxID=2648818 RepID=UPI00088E2CE4|nr:MULTISPECIES: PRD domain-containing protein [unclassified Candidatus Frackibacter]SDC29933.1 transcriptional antiterminator, BglG family [Candidatus Frackibacter sp. WG11]SEM94721.1 transcriptional antiterminator, BglG family [Candidatus Frackibacter sp. WG12]SFL57773.1 transcriptional antiterminator, BglG family [Candidatus Frackibacter sp. WG13]